MASISSLSSSTNNALSSLRGYGGLSSGMDRDELIEGMTSATQSKITKQQQAKTKLEWQQEAYREISDKMIGFADKYTATMTSKSNLFSDALWNAANTSVNGTNSKYVSVIGTSKAAADVAIMGIKQMAKNASMTSKGNVSDGKLKTGVINMSKVNMSTLDGKELEFKIGSDTYTVTLPNRGGEPYGSVKELETALNEALRGVDVNMSSNTGGTRKLSEFVRFGSDASTGKLTIKALDTSNDISLIGGSATEALGFKEQADKKDGEEHVGLKLTGNAESANDAVKLSEQQAFDQRIGGKQLTFNYNGVTATITLPDAADIRAKMEEARTAKAAETPKPTNEEIIKAAQDAGLEFVKNQLQDSLDAKFGKGRVTAELEETDEGKRLTFRTTVPNEKETVDGKEVAKADNSSTLSITEGSSVLMSGHGGFGFASGESNRVNLNGALKDSGLANFGNVNANTIVEGSDKVEEQFEYVINVNGKNIGFNGSDSMSNIMKKINESNAGVKISYLSTADKFVVEATENGAAGELKLSGNGAELLFGEEIDSSNANAAAKNNITAGQDAIIAVKYAGSDEAVEMRRGTNNFSVEGLDVTIKGEFGYEKKADGTKELITNDVDQPVTFTSNIDSEKLVTAISDMVKEYNEILDMVNTHLSTRPDSDYTPLTSEQKKEMSEDEIKLWEEKAKAGILYNSSEIRQLSNDLRFMISAGDYQTLSEMGLSVSSNWQDNGKLTFDENKFKAALEKDVDAVRNMFTKSDGIATNLKNTMDKYVKTMGATKGILIEKAGSTKSPTSVLKNQLKTQMEDIDKILENLKNRLKSEQDRYINQFTQLETLISQMNAQSSYLSGLGF